MLFINSFLAGEHGHVDAPVISRAQLRKIYLGSWPIYVTSTTKKSNRIINNTEKRDDTENITGTVSRDFQLLFFYLKDSTWAPYEEAKTVSLSRVCVVNDYVDTHIFL